MKPSRSDGGMEANMGREARGNGGCTKAEGESRESLVSLCGEGVEETCCVPTSTCAAQ